jgi:hypothetical protein
VVLLGIPRLRGLFLLPRARHGVLSSPFAGSVRSAINPIFTYAW